MYIIFVIIKIIPTEIAAKEMHAPFGMPAVDVTGSSYCELAQSNYVTGYSHDHHMPLFVSYTMEKRDVSDILFNLFYFQIISIINQWLDITL